MNHFKYRLNCFEARILKKKGERSRMTKKIEAKDNPNLVRIRIWMIVIVSPHNADTKRSLVFLWRQIVYKIYTRSWCEQLWVAERCERRMWEYLHKKNEKSDYETSLDDAFRYKYVWSLIHWRTIVLSEKSVRIVRWALLVLLRRYIDETSEKMKLLDGFLQQIGLEI